MYHAGKGITGIMRYLWTEDSGAGFHYWQLVNEYLLDGSFIVESKNGNQKLLDEVRNLKPEKGDVYYIAFDIVYDNMDIMNKYLELHQISKKYPENIVLLDVLCFEAVIFSFRNLVTWTGTGKQDKITIRNYLLKALEGHKIHIEKIDDEKTLGYLMGFKHYSTEKVLKSLTYELTENDEWSVKGGRMGRCWYCDCCIRGDKPKVFCNIPDDISGREKMITLLKDDETQRMIKTAGIL